MRLKELTLSICTTAIIFVGACATAFGASTLDMPGVTAAGLGGASAALQNDASLMVSNPAGLSALTDNEVAAEAAFAEGERAYKVSLLQKNQNGVSGGLYVMSLTEDSGLAYYDVGYSVALGPWGGASLGTTLHYLRDRMASKSLEGWSVDAGVHQDLGIVKLGASVRNAWSGGAGVSDARFPQEIRAGFAVGYSPMKLALDAVKTSGSDELTYAGGISYQVLSVDLSCGITKQGEALKYSAGLQVPIKAMKLGIAVQWEDGQEADGQVGWAYKF